MTDSFLWNSQELINELDGKLIIGNLCSIKGVSIDSRNINFGDIFFAIKGPFYNGHDYIKNAIQNGAVIIVISNKKYISNYTTNVGIVLVDDVLLAINRLGIAARKRTRAKIIAVTGSVGKTSIKNFLAICLKKYGKVHASVKSFNNYLGVPISLAAMPKNTQFGIFEIGMNHLNEITPLVKMVLPNLVIVTNVYSAHLGNFKSLKEIASAKAEIFNGLNKCGIVVLNRDNKFFNYLKNKALYKGIKNVFSFGKNKNANMKLNSVELLPNNSNITANYNGNIFKYSINIAGAHQVYNSLCLLLVIKLIGIDFNKILPLLKTIKLDNGRGIRFEITIKDGSIILIDESYNANYTSMVAALNVLSIQNTKKNGRKIAIIGDILELGIHSVVVHTELAKHIIDIDIDVVFACGKYIKNCYNLLPKKKRGLYADNSNALSKNLLNNIRVNDVIMVKGSSGSKMHLIINKIKNNK